MPQHLFAAIRVGGWFYLTFQHVSRISQRLVAMDAKCVTGMVNERDRVSIFSLYRSYVSVKKTRIRVRHACKLNRTGQMTRRAQRFARTKFPIFFSPSTPLEFFVLATFFSSLSLPSRLSRFRKCRSSLPTLLFGKFELVNHCFC